MFQPETELSTYVPLIHVPLVLNTLTLQPIGKLLVPPHHHHDEHGVDIAHLDTWDNWEEWLPAFAAEE